MTYDLTLNNSLPSSYKAIIAQYPLLSAQDEHALAVKFVEDNNLQAAETLVFSNLRGVVFIARQYSGYGLPFMDMVQEGTVGLMRAVRKYNPYKNVRLFPYALPWIKAEIQKYVVNNWRIVKATTTDSKKKLFFNLRSLKTKLFPLGDAANERIVLELNVPLKDVVAMDKHMHLYDESTDVVEGSAMLLSLPSPESMQPEVIALELENEHMATTGISSALASLDSRSSDIIRSRYLTEPPETLSTLATRYSISVERVRQIESSTLTKLRKELPYFSTEN